MTGTEYCARDANGQPLKVGDRITTHGGSGPEYEGTITAISWPDLVSCGDEERVSGWLVTVAYDDGTTQEWESRCEGPWADDLVEDVELAGVVA